MIDMKLKDFQRKLLKDQKYNDEYYKYDLAFEVGQMLIEARIIKGITQEKLAAMIETKQTSIARAENGKHLPSLSFLQKLAVAFGTYLTCPRFGFMVKNVELNHHANSVKQEDQGISLEGYMSSNVLYALTAEKSESQLLQSHFTRGFV